MRTPFLVALIIGAVAVIPVEAKAQFSRWCAGYNVSGASNCGFATYKQCQTTISEIGGWCYRNPAVTARASRRNAILSLRTSALGFPRTTAFRIASSGRNDQTCGNGGEWTSVPIIVSRRHPPFIWMPKNGASFAARPSSANAVCRGRTVCKIGNSSK